MLVFKSLYIDYVFFYQLDGNVSGMKLGLVTEGMANCEEDVVALVRSACEHYKTLGVTVEEVSIPEHVHCKQISKWHCKNRDN